MVANREKGSMTLHEAMLVMLQEAGTSLTSRQIADEIHRLGLYVRVDGGAASASQVSARARRYPHLFVRTGDNKHITLRR